MADESTTATESPTIAQSRDGSAAQEPAAAPKKEETFRQKMDRLGGFGGDDGPTKDPLAGPEPTEETADNKPVDKKASAKKVQDAPAPTEPVGSVEELRALATRHGFVVEDGKVTTAERVKLRDERRQNLAAVAKARDEALAEITKLKGEAEPDIKLGLALKQAAAERDYEGIAKALGHKDWNALQEDVIAAHADPNYKRVKALEERERQREEAEKQRLEREEQARIAMEKQRAQAQYKQKLSTDMAASSDPLVKAMSKMPNFVNAVFNVQQHAYQGRGEAITPELAIRESVNGGTPLMDELKSLHDALAPVFAKSIVSAAEPTEKAGTTAKPAPKSPKVPERDTPKPAKKLDNDGEYFADFRRRMRAAADEDDRAGVLNGRGY